MSGSQKNEEGKEKKSPVEIIVREGKSQKEYVQRGKCPAAVKSKLKLALNCNV